MSTKVEIKHRRTGARDIINRHIAYYAVDNVYRIAP